MDRGAWMATVHSVTESDMIEATEQALARVEVVNKWADTFALQTDHASIRPLQKVGRVHDYLWYISGCHQGGYQSKL